MSYLWADDVTKNERDEMAAVLRVFDNLSRKMDEQTAPAYAELLGVPPERLLFVKHLYRNGGINDSFLGGCTMALTYSIVLQVLKLVRDVPDVIPVDRLVQAGMDLVDMQRLAANHSGIPLPDGHQPTPSNMRYAGSVFQVDDLLTDAEGVYTPDLLTYLAGKLNVAWQSPFESPGANIRYMRTRIEDAAVKATQG